MEMNFTKVKEDFVNNRPKNKHLLQFMHKCYDVRDMQLDLRLMFKQSNFEIVSLF